MKFWFKIAFLILSLELLLFLAVGTILTASIHPALLRAIEPIFFQAGLVSLLVGMLVAIMVSTITGREITRRTGALHEGWGKSMSILQSLPAGVVIIDPAKHKIIDANSAALKAFGVPKKKVIGSVCHKFLCPAEEGFCPITDLKQDADSSERLLVTADGETVPILKTVVPFKFQKKKHLLEMFFDISERKNRDREIKDAFTHQANIANYDLLTGVFNRRAITTHAEAELNRAERGSTLSVMLIDLDHFKKINDIHGHLVGDKVLKFIADLISKNIRPYDWVGRWGGEEFLVLLPETSSLEAGEIAERLRQSVNSARPALAEDGELPLSISAGIASTSMFDRKSLRLDSLVKLADDALYKAKSRGRNRIEISGMR